MADDGRIYELRTYHASAGKRDALLARFRGHTLDLFARHGITVEGFFVPDDDHDESLVYLCSYPSADAAKASWAAFQADEEWIAAKKASEVDGPLAASVESRYYLPTDFSPMQ